MSASSRLFRRIFSTRTLAVGSGGTVLFLGVGYWYLNSGPSYPPSLLQNRRPPQLWSPPTRQEMIDRLKGKGKEQEFDILVVGGGATGAGVAVDCATRGLNVGLLERDDFSSGTSSKSTKLVHGGVRYLQKAVFELDYDQYKLVKEALHERKIFLYTAPYLSNMLPIMLPIYKYWQIPYYYAGCKLYDILAGEENMETSYLMSKGKALETFPMLKSDGLVGAVVYYDGQHNDTRMNVALVLTAVKHGATVANYCEVVKLHKNDQGRLCGARVRDNLTGEEWDVKTKGIINATGPYTDTLMTLDNPSHNPIVQPSSGIHVTLPNYYSPRKMGLLDPATSDGRVIFFLPWQGNTIAGTTDTPAKLEANPVAQEEEIQWVLEEIRRYLSPDIKVRRGDVLSAWSGLRPLVRDPDASTTEGIVRNHIVHTSPSGLVTIAGGKWTTYREMAQATVDEAVNVFGLAQKAAPCVTERVRLVGSDGWSRNMFIGLIQRYGIATDIAKHLSESYGDRAWMVCEKAEETGEEWPIHGKRLSPNYPYLEAEVRYVVHNEYAVKVTDVIARRTRLAFLNANSARQALPQVVELMGAELGWSKAEKRHQLEDGVQFLKSMGLWVPPPQAQPSIWSWIWRKCRFGLSDSFEAHSTSMSRSRSIFGSGEVTALRSSFAKASFYSDNTRMQMVHLRDLQKILADVGFGYGYDCIPARHYRYVLTEAGFEGRDALDLDEFLEFCGSLKEISVSEAASAAMRSKKRGIIPVEKSGGGV